MIAALLLLACSSNPPTTAEEPQGSPAEATAEATAPEASPAAPLAEAPEVEWDGSTGDVVLVIVDTLRYDALGRGGNQRPASPAIDAFAEENLWFTRAYSPGTWTLPSTASIFTGLSPFQHKAVHDAREPYKFGRLEAHHVTTAEAFKERGFRTAGFINNSYLAPEFGLNQGFDVYDFEGPGLIDHRTGLTTVELALEWLASSEEPAFVTVHMMEPHADYQPPEGIAGTFGRGMPHTLNVPLGGEVVESMIANRFIPEPDDQAFIKALYDEEVLTADGAVGRLIEGLKAMDDYSDMTVIFVSDHGEEFWEHGEYEHGHTTRKEVTHVPLIVKAPWAGNGENNTVVSIAAVHEALLGGGVIREVAEAREHRMGEMVIIEDLLYGTQEISVVSDALRFTFDQANEVVSLVELSPAGEELRDISMDASRRAEAEPLFNAIMEARGDMAPLIAADPVEVRTSSVFEQLRALGYVQ